MKKTICDFNLENKTVIIRVDFNVPIVNGKITDDNRIVEAIPTIKYLIDNGAAVILMSHLGRPDGKFMPEFSLKPVAKRLEQLMKTKVLMADDVVGESAKKLASELKSGDILLIENLRFEAGEEENDEEFTKKLAGLADIYVNDAFGTAHRKHASTYGLAKYLPSAVGFLIEKELRIIVDTINNPKRPFVGILGGAKVADKLSIVNSLLDKVDTLIIGGGMSYTFQKSQGFEIGNSLLDETKLEDVKLMMQKAKDKKVNLLLPIDYVVAKSIDDVASKKVVEDCNIPDGYMGVDIGPKTIKLYTDAIKNAKTVIWNGPMGVFEQDEFAVGTNKVAVALTEIKNGTTIIGGGDSASAIINMGLQDKITHISTGGGASLKLFEGKELPGVAAIADRK